MNRFAARNVEQWREWLHKHHEVKSEVWLVFYKRHTGRPSIDYQDAVDEALCFGWIDSLIKRVDDSRYARKFTPRKRDSQWSRMNRKRYAELKAQGRLQAAGVDRPPTDKRSSPRPRVPLRVPEYLQAALRKRPAALRHFKGLPPSYRRRYVLWIDSSKRADTKARRVHEAIRLLEAGRMLGLK